MEENTNGFTTEQHNYNFNGFTPQYNPVQEELRAVKRSGNGVGLTIFGFFVCQFILADIIDSFHIDRIISGNEVMEKSVNILYAILCILIPFLIYAFATRKSGTEIMPLKRTKPSLFIPLVFIGMAVAIIGNLATGMLIENMGKFGITLKSPNYTSPATAGGIILSLISTALIPALCEELAMRGIIMQSLRKFGDSFAIFTSALLFAVMHGNFVQAPFAFIGGLSFGYITIKTGSLWCAVAIHFINNSLSVFFDIISPLVTHEMFVFIDNAVYFLLLFAGIVSLIFMLKKRSDFFNFQERPTLTTFRQKLTAFIGTPGVIFSLIVIARLSALYLEVSWLNG